MNSKENCLRAIAKLVRLTKSRSDPSNTLINIAEACNNLTMDEEAWGNFYEYITTENRENWEYKPREKLKTLGDLSADEMEKIERDLDAKSTFCNRGAYKVFENGIETFVDVKYLDSNTIKELNDAERVAHLRKTVEEEKSWSEPENQLKISIGGMEKTEEKIPE